LALVDIGDDETPKYLDDFDLGVAGMYIKGMEMSPCGHVLQAETTTTTMSRSSVTTTTTETRDGVVISTTITTVKSSEKHQSPCLSYFMAPTPIRTASDYTTTPVFKRNSLFVTEDTVDTRYVVVSGGSVSGLGKGTAISSLG
ncbi:hypothetical protein FOZ62_006872, partial [Perkinsus olseni]